ncbi:hypothetical protein BDV25DRAFT_128148 [Aspergillus avenaceus]|uniref:Tyrosinase copper-binding domain-containing protein n=1 Tax=Aspergillus avenaceus TaxID=36643 RepID=A0A5N6U111_ASPAV|nr:hypothetical protein BDV25DRAFT_128148 [Aspergillus avenaceus]
MFQTRPSSSIKTTIALTAAAVLGLAPTTLTSCKNPGVRKSALGYDERADYINFILCLMNPEMSLRRREHMDPKAAGMSLLLMWRRCSLPMLWALSFPWHCWYTRVHESLLRNGCVVDGAFANLKMKLTTELTRTTDICLTRAFNQTQSGSVLQDIVDICIEINGYWQMWAVGGTIEHVSFSVFDPILDPILVLHHTNLDRLWTQWQFRNTSRLTAMGGPIIAPATLFGEAQSSSLGVGTFLPYFGDHGNTTT